MVTARSQTEHQYGEEDGGGSGRSSAPSASAIFVVYSILGSVLSYAIGREPGTLPEDVVRELSPTVAIICLFITSYSLLDVMAVGAAKAKHGLSSKAYGSSQSNPPEEVYLAQRTQTNQIEQLPGFIVASLSFTVLVNGKAGALLSCIWAVLRRLYARTYRASLGKPINKSGVVTYTIPAYFVQNAMLMGTVVQCVRCLMK